MKNMIMNFFRRFFFPAAKEDLVDFVKKQDLKPLATKEAENIHQRRISRLEERVGV